MVKKSFKEKVHDFVEKVKAKAKEVWQKLKKWVTDHPQTTEQCVGLVITLVPVIFKGARHISKRNSLHETKELKTKYLYDNRHGFYYKMRRTPTNRQYMEISRRADLGEDYGDILASMRLI